jgi:hypothetical protein
VERLETLLCGAAATAVAARRNPVGGASGQAGTAS